MDPDLPRSERPRLATVVGPLGSTLLRTRSALSRRIARRTRRPDYIEGTPEGLSRQALELVVRQQLGSVALERIRHEHLSNWKRTGAFRVRVDLANGPTWSVVFKDACYHRNDIPALDGFPLSPGAPEYLVYLAGAEAVLPYLPEVYQCREIASGSHYLYLTEDLSRRHVRLRQPQLASVVSRELPAIHAALATLIDDRDGNGFLRFDRDFSVALLEYAAAALHELASKRPLRRVEAMLSAWGRLERVYRRGLVSTYDLVDLAPIHGDLNPMNIWADPNEPSRLRLVDWEWAGVGIPHADLVSACKAGSPAVEREAVRRYNLATNERTFDEDHGIFSWCKLQRCVLDAAFFARQLLGAPGVPPSLDLARKVERPLRTIEVMLGTPVP